MKNEQRLLTIKEFAKEMGVCPDTVYKWILKGRLEGVVREYTNFPYLIPESNLSVGFMKPGRPKGIYIPITSSEEARERYNRADYIRTIPFTYDELKEMFDGGMTYEEVSVLAGVTKQRIHQVYRDYFAPFSITGRVRRKALNNERRRLRAEAHVERIEKLSLLKQIAEEIGFSVETVQSIRNPSYCYSDRLIINGKICRVNFSKVSRKTREEGHRYYYKVHISKSATKMSNFIVVLTGEGAKNIFIFPSDFIASQIPDDESGKMFYIPTDKQDPYNNIHPNIDWWQFYERWSQLVLV